MTIQGLQLIGVDRPGRDDVLEVARGAAGAGAALVADPETLQRMTAGLVPWGPACSRTTLSGALRAAGVAVDVRADDRVPAGVVVIDRP